jgi:hypothetical protein
VVKSATADAYAGTAMATANGMGFVNPVPFTAQKTKVSVRVWSPDAGVVIRLKLQDHTNDAVFVEATAITSVASEWQTLEFDFANSGLDLNSNYDKAIIFFNDGVSGAIAGEKTYYFDDVKFVNAASGISANDALNMITVYPNPVAQRVSVTNTSGTPLRIALVDMHGKTAKLINSSVSKIEIDVTDLSAGMYILSIENRINHQRTTRKIIKQ